MVVNMLKNVVVLEANDKEDVLCQVEIHTPREFMFASTTEQILNCKIFEEFIDEAFMYTISELRHICMRKYNKKINNVYITFIDNDDKFVCSIVIDKLNPKRYTYRMKVTDWQSTGCIFKYKNNEDVFDNFNNDVKPEF